MYQECHYTGFQDELHFINLLVNGTWSTHGQAGMVDFILGAGNNVPNLLVWM
jgi:hypothetical protein